MLDNNFKFGYPFEVEVMSRIGSGAEHHPEAHEDLLVASEAILLVRMKTLSRGGFTCLANSPLQEGAAGSACAREATRETLAADGGSFAPGSPPLPLSAGWDGAIPRGALAAGFLRVFPYRDPPRPLGAFCSVSRPPAAAAPSPVPAG